MKNNKTYYLSLLAMIGVLFSGCEAIATIFEAGFWSAILLVGLVVVIIIAIIFKTKK